MHIDASGNSLWLFMLCNARTVTWQSRSCRPLKRMATAMPQIAPANYQPSLLASALQVYKHNHLCVFETTTKNRWVRMCPWRDTTIVSSSVGILPRKRIQRLYDSISAPHQSNSIRVMTYLTPIEYIKQLYTLVYFETVDYWLRRDMVVTIVVLEWSVEKKFSGVTSPQLPSVQSSTQSLLGLGMKRYSDSESEYRFIRVRVPLHSNN